MKLTVTVTAGDQDGLALGLREVLRYVEEGYKEGHDKNPIGSLSFDIDGWDADEDDSNPYEDDGQPSDLTEHSDFAQDDMPEHDGIGECW